MKQQIYQQIRNLLESSRYGVLIINLINQLVTGIVYMIYPLFLFYLAYYQDLRFWNSLLIPALSFFLISWFRRIINAPRPYEVFNQPPLIGKNTLGKSFPSRHVFSAFVIATTIYPIFSWLGLLLMLSGLLLAIVRVLGGVHFWRDVIVGALLGLAFGFINWL